MAGEQLDHGRADGAIVGRSSGKLGFYGLATPVVQPSVTSLVTMSAVQVNTTGEWGFNTSTELTRLLNWVTDVDTALKALGLVAEG